MRPDNEGDESEQFIELYETGNVIEQVAQTIVAQVRAMVQHRARYELVDASDFPERDANYYRRIESELSTLGFRSLGDFEDAGATPALRGQSFVRFALGAHGAIAASWFEVPKPDSGPARCLALHSWLDDGRTIITSRETTDSGLPVHPDVVIERVDPALDVISTVRAHGERVAASGRAPRRLDALSDLLAAYSSDELKTAEFREAQGPALFEPILRTALGANFEEQGEPILDAIQRHPEWVRGDISIEPTGMRVRAVRGGEVDAERFPHMVIARMPEHIGPMDRAERYEEPLQDALAIRELGVVTGGGSELTPTAEIGFVEVELALVDLDGALDVTKRMLEESGAPVGSQLLFQKEGRDVELPFGVQEAVAVYLDGVSLPDEVYEQLDIDEFAERLAAAAASVGGESRATWSGASETAFYQYGPSAAAMLDALSPVLDAYPVCQNARIVIREGADGATRTIRRPKLNGA